MNLFAYTTQLSTVALSMTISLKVAKFLRATNKRQVNAFMI